jgi:hypothetical protein
MSAFAILHLSRNRNIEQARILRRQSVLKVIAFGFKSKLLFPNGYLFEGRGHNSEA